ncbi:acyl-CoA synthetase [Methylorubrum thiocyanatum]|uniref:acyl-CoA synthetase n=1 Tax=Methylorubrum thiocyanatum TaxID=47958 RepID=UPI00383B43B7
MTVDVDPVSNEGRNAANFVPLTPLTFLDRAAQVWPDRVAVVHGEVRRSWSETRARCRRLASALARRGVLPGQTVAFLAANTPELYEAHFGVPLAGAVLAAINTRLDASTIAYMLDHSEARMFFVDREFATLAKAAATRLDRDIDLVEIVDPSCGNQEALGAMNYEAFLEEGASDCDPPGATDEWAPIALNYTSGTTGDPKGVVYHHRGAYLNAVSNILSWGMAEAPTYLWTLPMFHCNGWCFPWTVAAAAGTNVFLRAVRADRIFALVREEQVTHLCGAPIVLSLLNSAPEEQRTAIEHPVKVMVAGAPPPATVIAGMESMGWQVTHVYGLTESYGPTVVNVDQAAFADLDADVRAALKARQGVRGPMLEAVIVADPATLAPVSRDGRTIGEVMMRGNNLFREYLKNPTATAEAFSGGWFHTGDLAVWHDDGYVEIKDRSKDIIISGGENISSIEIENALYAHPAVMLAAVVAKSDERWGEVPCAFVELRPDAEAISQAELIAHCRERLAKFKLPKEIVFTTIPRTSTGKVQKFVLRSVANSDRRDETT